MLRKCLRNINYCISTYLSTISRSIKETQRHPERPKKIVDFRRESKDLGTELTAYVP